MKILSLQGGGCRGKGQAVALAALEQQAGKPLCQVFDAVGGTSVGAIVGAAVSIGLPMREVNRFFDQEAPKIFAGGWWSTARQLWESKYDGAKLTASLQSIFGDHTLADCKTEFIITAFDVDSGRNVYFQNYGESSSNGEEIVFGEKSPFMDWPIWKIVQASASAQSYFPAMQLGSMVLIDGGNTGCAAPDMLLLTEAIEAGATTNRIEMLSLGTGASPWSVKGRGLKNPCALRAGLATLDILFAGANATEVWQAASILGENHYRLNPTLSIGFALDDARSETLAAIKLVMENEIASHPECFKPFLA